MIFTLAFQVFTYSMPGPHKQFLNGIKEAIIQVEQHVWDIMKYFLPGDPRDIVFLPTVIAEITPEQVSAIFATRGDGFHVYLLEWTIFYLEGNWPGSLLQLRE